MKVLENPELDALNVELCVTQGDRRIFGRLESFSCKMAGPDKKFFKEFAYCPVARA